MSNIDESRAMILSRADWQLLFLDREKLLKHPGSHHKALIVGAHALHRAKLINGDDLSDLLEQADGALAYAVEALLDDWQVGER